MDFRSLAGIQDWFNRKGLISVRGEKKQAFFVMQEFYRSARTQTPRRGAVTSATTPAYINIRSSLTRTTRAA
jgi:hypothetical protein